MNRHVRYAVARFLGVDLAAEQLRRVDFCTTLVEAQAVRILLRAPDFHPSWELRPGVAAGSPRDGRTRGSINDGPFGCTGADALWSAGSGIPLAPGDPRGPVRGFRLPERGSPASGAPWRAPRTDPNHSSVKE